MSYLRCNARHCANNKNELCVLNQIRVDGTFADCRDETCCGSFTQAAENYSNVVSRNSEPKPETEIGCDVRRCSFNKECRCSAPSVDISGSEACACGETRCSTFDLKK